MTNWEQNDVFPIIARIIGSCFGNKQDFVTHDEIVESLLTDNEGSSIIEQARIESGDSHATNWLAHNMVAWFSQRISTGQSDWEDSFDRVKIKGKWAYRPK